MMKLTHQKSSKPVVNYIYELFVYKFTLIYNCLYLCHYKYRYHHIFKICPLSLYTCLVSTPTPLAVKYLKAELNCNLNLNYNEYCHFNLHERDVRDKTDISIDSFEAVHVLTVHNQVFWFNLWNNCFCKVVSTALFKMHRKERDKWLINIWKNVQTYTYQRNVNEKNTDFFLIYQIGKFKWVLHSVWENEHLAIWSICFKCSYLLFQ